MLEILDKTDLSLSSLPPNLKDFLVRCSDDPDHVMTSHRLFQMMRYYKVETSWSRDATVDIGDYIVGMVCHLRTLESRFSGGIVGVPIDEISFLVDIYRSLKIDVSSRAQHRILKNCFMLISDVDCKWFARILCKDARAMRTIRGILDTRPPVSISPPPAS